MNPLRWSLVGIGLALLLSVAGHGTLRASAGAAAIAQALPPLPSREWGSRTVVSPTVRAESEPAEVQSAADITATAAPTATGVPTYYVVLPGDTLSAIAESFGTTLDGLMAANGLRNPDLLNAGQVLAVPGPDGSLPDPAGMPVLTADGTLTQTLIGARGTITERMTSLARQAGPGSPFHGTTWLTYYGRPNIPIMGILGEHPVEDLVPLLRAEAEAYDRANGDSLAVMPAFHLVYGMATKAAGEDGSHLAYMADDEVLAYVEAAEAEGWSVILDIQIGGLTPTAAINPALPFLKYPNVHLAIDPEFAMRHPGQVWPGNPIGFVTPDEVNQVQAVINAYLAAKRVPAPRILLVHQFQSSMIVEKEKLDATTYSRVALTLSVDGWGGPWGKISKYDSLVSVDSPYTAFKLFYRWDEPLLTPEEALGVWPYRGSDFAIDITPNLIIYQ